jgi:hypothetical protein
MQKMSIKLIKTIRNILLVAIGGIGSVYSFMATWIHYMEYETSCSNPTQRYPATNSHIYFRDFCISLLLLALFAIMSIIPFLDRKVKPGLLKHSVFVLYGAIGMCVFTKVCLFWRNLLMQRIENGEVILENSSNFYLHCGISAFVVLSLFICIFLVITYSHAVWANSHPLAK